MQTDIYPHLTPTTTVRYHTHSFVPNEDPDTRGVPPLSPLSPPPSTKEKQSGRVERVKEEEKSIEESRQPQVPQFKRLVRVITSDEEFERELRQAGEALVVVDFTTERWVIKLCCVPCCLHEPKML